MKRLSNDHSWLLIAEYYLLSLANSLLHPLGNMPEPDFNNQYDLTIL
ncbi:MAG TPA: hypothetical protein VF476_01930 [Chitinophagaceae bacterium]